MEESESHSRLRTQIQYIRGHPIFQSFNSALCDQQLTLSGNIFFHKATWLYKHLILTAYVRTFSPREYSSRFMAHDSAENVRVGGVYSSLPDAWACKLMHAD